MVASLKFSTSDVAIEAYLVLRSTQIYAFYRLVSKFESNLLVFQTCEVLNWKFAKDLVFNNVPPLPLLGAT